MQNLVQFLENLQISINYAKVCLYTSWQIANPSDFTGTYEEYGIKCEDIVILERNSKFIAHSVFTNWRMFIIEIDKIYDNKSKQGIRKLFNKLTNNVDGFALPDKNFEIKAVLDMFEYEILRNKDLIEQIRFIRDKFYGHRDADFFIEHQHELKYHRASELIEVAEKVVTEICKLTEIPVIIYDRNRLASYTGLLLFQRLSNEKTNSGKHK